MVARRPRHREALPSLSERSRVLIADEDHLGRDMLKRAINRQPDLEVVGEAHDVLGTLSLCRRLLPDIALIEASLPETGGIEATRRIKGEFPGLPVVVVNTVGDPNHLLEALEAG